MSSLHFWYKVTRIEQCCIAAISTWLIALLSNGPLWFNTPKIAAAFCIFFSCLGASVFHYGMSHDIYLLKWWDKVVVTNPRLLKVLGSIAFITSIGIAAVFLPTICLMIAAINFVIILAYSGWLDRFWPFKNIAIALLCTSPIIIGWLSGHRLNPAVPPVLAATFLIYMSREMLKDIMDLQANQGKRFTMVMSLGEKQTLKIAGIFMTVALCFLGRAAFHLPGSAFVIYPYIIALVVFLTYAANLLKSLPMAKYYRGLDLGIVMLMIAFFCIRAGLP